MGLNVFTFDAKQPQGVSEDEFVSDLIQLSLPSAENDVEIEICHEHGLNPYPSESKTSASRVVFFYQPHDPSAKMEHSIEFDEKIVIVRAGQPKIAALLQLSIVKILVSPPAPAAAPAAVSSVDDVTLSFFTYFYGLGREMGNYYTLACLFYFIVYKFSHAIQSISSRNERTGLGHGLSMEDRRKIHRSCSHRL